jgi:tetratricopeptide (TPR) repeat protein
MARIVKLLVESPQKLGLKKVKKRRKPDPEDFGQLNLFDSSKVVELHKVKDYFEQAILLDDEGDDRAIEFYEKAIETRQSVADSYCNIGIIYYQKEDNAKAVNYFTQCLKEEPRHHEAHYNLGNVYSELENFSLAEFHYKLSIEIDPGFANSHYNYSLLLTSEKKYPEAVYYLTNYLNLAKDQANESQYSLLNTLKSFLK